MGAATHKDRSTKRSTNKTSTRVRRIQDVRASAKNTVMGYLLQKRKILFNRVLSLNVRMPIFVCAINPLKIRKLPITLNSPAKNRRFQLGRHPLTAIPTHRHRWGIMSITKVHMRPIIHSLQKANN